MDPGRREDGVRRDHDQGRRRIASDRVLAGDLRRLDPGWPEQGGRDAFLALGERHDITGIVHLAAGGLEVTDPMEFLRVNTGGLLNALEAARSWGVHGFAVASSIGVYAGRSETRWHEELALPTTTGTHPIPAFKKAVETLTMLGLADSGVQAVLLRIGTIWGPLGLPDSPFIPFPALINAVAKGQEPPTLYADDGGDRCYAPDAGLAIALALRDPRRGKTALTGLWRRVRAIPLPRPALSLVCNAAPAHSGRFSRRRRLSGRSIWRTGTPGTRWDRTPRPHEC